MTRRDRLHEIIFEAETPAGKAFDVILLIAILLSVVAVCLESVDSIHENYGNVLRAAEWSFTILFTIEYLLRMYSVRRPLRYMFSFFGLVDLLSILPTYLSMFFPGAQSLLVIRALRFLRVFRVLKLGHFLSEAKVMQSALAQSRRKITVFLASVLIVTLIVGSLMYLIEGPEHGFTNVPKGIYWTIVTMTTVGYGDITPQTPLGKLLASIVMILGYGIIAVPTGIVTAEMAAAIANQPVSTQACPGCSKDGHMYDAKHCKYCGTEL